MATFKGSFTSRPGEETRPWGEGGKSQNQNQNQTNQPTTTKNHLQTKTKTKQKANLPKQKQTKKPNNQRKPLQGPTHPPNSTGCWGREGFGLAGLNRFPISLVMLSCPCIYKTSPRWESNPEVQSGPGREECARDFVWTRDLLCLRAGLKHFLPLIFEVKGKLL